MSRDEIFSLPLDRVGDFEFDEQVVEVFPDMIARSVPGYASILAMTAELAARFAQPNTRVYDLGCSLGAATRLMRKRIPSSCTIHAIDSSPAMITQLRKTLASEADEGCFVDVGEADIREVLVSDASFAVLNFTLQFVPAAEREPLLEKIFLGLRGGGALVLSEKVHFTAPGKQALLTELHHSFKRAHGYSELEIAQKRTALENTLFTETLESHIERLERVGFTDVALWFQCFNFASILAVK